MQCGNAQDHGCPDHGGFARLRGRRPWTVLGVILTAIIGLAVWLGSGNDEAVARIGTAVTMIAALCGGLATWSRASRRASAGDGWRLIALGCWIWALGRMAQIDFLLGTGKDGIHAVAANVGFLGMLPFVVAGIVRLRPPRRQQRDGHKLLMDLVIGVATSIAVGWAWIIRPTIEHEALSWTVRTLIAVHAIGDGLLLLTLLVVLLRQGDQPLPRSLGLLAAGATLLTLADLLWLSSWAEIGYHLGGFATPAWVAGFIGLGAAADSERRLAQSAPSSVLAFDRDREPIWRVAILYGQALLLLVLIALEASAGTRGNGEAVVIVGSLTIIALIMVRLGLTLGESQRAAGRLTQQVDRDSLTGLINHRKVHQLLDRELADAYAGGRSVAVALLDVDNFKAINDRCGHQAGDQVLRKLADILTRACRGSDVAARYGGDEFMLVLPGLDPVDARKVGQRVLDEIARHVVRPTPETGTIVGVSIGLAVTRDGGRSSKQLIAIADAAMYDAKATGKNRVVIVDADRLVTVLGIRPDSRRGQLSQTEPVRLAR